MVNIQITGKNKIIVVAYPLGRIGSSAVMGLLQLAGVNVGAEIRLIGPGIINPKGFFELKSQEQFLEKIFKGVYPGVTDPPSLENIDKIGKSNYWEYHELIVSEFGGRFPIAVKSQRFLSLSFLYHLKGKYDIRVLVMERNENHQVNSTIRVWRKATDSLKKNAQFEFVLFWIRKWKKFSEEFMKYYDFNYFPVSFDHLVANPIRITKEITDYLEIEPPKDDVVKNWIDNSIVNREEI